MILHNMFLDEFIKVANNKVELQTALRILYRIGFFPVMYELSHQQIGQVSAENTLEIAAVQRGMSIGYFQAIRDILNMPVLFEKAETIKKIPSYGAAEALRTQGLTDKEIQDARQQWASSSGSKQ